jgi:hypothetical protein
MSTSDVDTIETLPEVREVSYEEGMQMLDKQARQYLGMSAEEFLHAWDTGAFPDPDGPGIMHVAMLIPFARPST